MTELSTGGGGDGTVRSAPNVNALWASVLVEEWVRQGVGLFVLAPGSRSAPLAIAVARSSRARYVVHVDERGCAFAALGHARATGRPAAVVTTSGTAVANVLAAAVEADHDGVPLLLLTADRPPELRDTGANQAIRQPGLFADTVRWHVDVPAPSADIPISFVLTTAAQAVHRSLAPRGPVHVNMMFREPLGVGADGVDIAALLAPVRHWVEGDQPYTRYHRPAARIEPSGVDRLARTERGIVVVGKSDNPELAPAAARLAESLGWPLLPDVGSGLRVGRAHSHVAPFYDAALASDRLASLRPDAVVHLGGRVVSKRLAMWLAESRPRDYVVVRDDPSRHDPSHIVTERVHANPVVWAEGATPADPAAKDGGVTSDWLRLWISASHAAERAIDDAFEGGDLSEPVAARVVAHTVPAGGSLVLGSSMPIRDVDAFAQAGPDGVRVAANRGASGIDGTVSTAAGFALGTGAPTALLLGDLALLHDLNGLALLRHPEMPPVVVVVINNDGGGIFSFLPIAEQTGVPFEALFGTPHGLGFEHAARMFEMQYSQPDSAPALATAIEEAFESGVSTLVEVRTDRRANRSLHADLSQRVAEGVDRVLGG